ncbi:PTS glucitol/sorbitol transporter subunit IIA [Qaidamihabitans albus]|uniref:PTS glucitol/sorbitol transporter subunit IIA n=1 Tax=Qaidamihabitans albus TaxID=2795733 RepID=UPI0018F261DA|nr:PTS glucitol/sorbitol transporter subunit IIA [Qaidamihabitans albus]
MTVYYESTVLRSGAEAGEMVEGGVVILYADPIPDALESVSVVHGPAKGPAREIRPGDVFALGEQRLDLVAVGERAHENLRSLGHIVVYLNPDEGTSLLPGAVHARGTLTVPAAGARLSLSGGGS